MKRTILYTAIYFFISCSYASEKPTVWLENNTIHYKGSLNDERNQMLFEIFKNNKSAVDTIEIESPGGEINKGLELGNFIYDNKLNIKVKSYCLSSCANYIFTAGNIKFVERDTIVGFHGGASSSEFDTSELDNLPEEFKKRAIQQFKSYLVKASKNEIHFFKKVGVRQEITTLGQDEKYDSFKEPEYFGWFYSKDTLIRMGVKNIHVSESNWTPKTELPNGNKLFKIDMKK